MTRGVGMVDGRLTESRFRRRLEKWQGSHHGEEERILSELFNCTYPDDSSFDEVLIKVAALNALYSAGVRQSGKHTEIARRIFKDRLIADIRGGGLEVIDSIARGPKQSSGGQYSFATKYCCFHNPQSYPIFDKYVVLALEKFIGQPCKEFGCTKVIDDEGKISVGLESYPDFYRAVGKFRGLLPFEEQRFSYKEIDHFLWYEGKALPGGGKKLGKGRKPKS